MIAAIGVGIALYLTHASAPPPSAANVPLRMTPQTPGPTTPTAIPPAAAPTFTLSASRVLVDTDVVIRFPSPVSSTGTARLWASISKQNAAPSSYETWSYISDGARVLTLRAPSTPGTYEVRLYTGYPRVPYNVGRTQPLVVDPIVEHPPQIAAPPPPSRVTPNTPANQRFSLAAAKIKAGAKIAIRFPQPMVAAPGEQFWVTVVPRATADTQYDAWTYVSANGTSAELPGPTTPGAYEVRLHANYPTKTANVVHRVPVQVE